MEVTYKMKATSKEVYDAVLQSVAEEVKQAVGKDVTVAEIEKGYKYKHKVKYGKLNPEITTRVKTQVNRDIHISSAYPSENIVMECKMEPVDEKTTLVTYSQTSSSAQKERLTFVNNMVLKKRLKNIEKYIIQTRKQETKE